MGGICLGGMYTLTRYTYFYPVNTTAYTVGSVVLVSCVALVCLVAVGWDEAKLRQRIPIMIAIASGVLLGEAGFHLLPEATRRGIAVQSALGLAGLGIAFCFIFERASRLILSTATVAPVARISLLAESVHNAMDGAIIAAAYLAGFRAGVLATLAVVMHEIPHELGNFSILIHAGYSPKKAFTFNLLSACAAILGAGAVVIAGKSLIAYSASFLPVAAGCFIYIAAFDLLPDLWKNSDRSMRSQVGCGTSIGLSLMWILTMAT